MTRELSVLLLLLFSLSAGADNNILRIRTKTGSTLIVPPYIQKVDDATGARTDLLFPLVLVHRSPNYNLTAQIPFFWRATHDDETDTLVPPFYLRLRSPTRKLDVFFPLGGYAQTETARTLVVGPIWHRREQSGNVSLGLPPLFVAGHHGADGHDDWWLATPLFYAERDRVNKSETLVAGPLFGKRDQHGYTAGLFPLVAAWRRDDVSRVISPIFYRYEDRARDADLNVLGPAYWGHEKDKQLFGLAPLVFGKTSDDGFAATVLPLFYASKRPDGSTLATPLGGYSTYSSGKRLAIGPFYLRRDYDYSSTAVFPFYYRMRNLHSSSRIDLAAPLYFDGRDEEGHELQAFTPLIWRYHSVESTAIVGLPLFFDVQRFGEGRTTGLLPFAIRQTDMVAHTDSVVLPPLLSWGRRNKDGHIDYVGFPVVWHLGHDEHRTTIVAPLVWDFQRGDSRTFVAAPLFSYWKREDGERALALNLYVRKGAGREAGSWYVNFFPLTDFGRPHAGDVEWNFLEGLVGYARQGPTRQLHLFWFGNATLPN